MAKPTSIKLLKKLYGRTILSRLDDLEMRADMRTGMTLPDDELIEVTQQPRPIISSTIIAPAASATDAEPTSENFTGVAMSGDGWTFDSVVWHWVAVLAGKLQVGINYLGQLLAGSVLIDENGISVGGRVVVDENGFLLEGGENIFMDTTNFNNILAVTDGGFSSLATGANGTIRCIAKDASGNIIVGGDFTQIGGVQANRIAKWDGSTWTRLGNGVTDGSVLWIVPIGSNVYFGGTFTESTLSFTASALSSSSSGASALSVPSANNQTAEGTIIPLNYIAYYNGTHVRPMGSSPNWGANGATYAGAVNGTTLYVGGAFTTMLGTSATRVCSINTSGFAVTALSTGLDGTCYGLTYSTDLYACGAFTDKVRRYNAGAWAAWGTGNPNGDCYGIAKSGNDVYVVGNFTNAGNYISLSTSGGAWGGLGAGLAAIGYSVAIDGSNIIAGYDAAEYVKYWTGAAWTSLGTGVNGLVNAIYVDTTWLIGGAYTTADDVTVYRISRYTTGTPTEMSLQVALDLLDDHKHYQLVGGFPNSTLGAGATRYSSLWVTNVNATEANAQIGVAACVFRNIRVTTNSAQPGTGTMVITVRKNGASTSMVATVTAGGAAGVYSDTTNSATFAANDLFDIMIINNSAGTSAQITGFVIEMELT